MEKLVKAHLDHRRAWLDFYYCYPVISRRSKGVSLGVNLNPDKLCNFDCVYCEVDRKTPPRRRDLDLDQMEREMSALLDLVVSGELFEVPPFDSALPSQRHLNDIAFSGDGEPTTAKLFPDAVSKMAELKRSKGVSDAKLVLITDSTRLQAPEVVRGIDIMMENRGEVWAKLDAGTEAMYQEINRSKVPFRRIRENLLFAGRRWPIFIQTLFFSWKGHGPSDDELAAYIAILQDLRANGAILSGIQLYTVARPTPEPEARPLRSIEMDRLAAVVKDSLPDLGLEVFYGPED